MENRKRNSSTGHKAVRYSRRRRQRRRISLMLLPLVLSVAFFAAGVRCVYQANASSQIEPKKYYTSVRIKYGDTLESIASEHMSPGYKDSAKYIKEIMKINRLNDTTIHAGEYLTIPYYSYEENPSDGSYSASTASESQL